MKNIYMRLIAFVALLLTSHMVHAADKFDLSVSASEGGKVSGSGEYIAGRRVSIRATALKGNVFAGWYADETYSTPLQGTVDYRTASFPYVVPETDSAVYAKFIPIAEDHASVSADVAPEYRTGTEIAPVAVAIDGASLPKASARGLPSGVRFNAKTNVIYGKPTRSGVYNATITVTTAGKAKATQSLKFIVRKPGETLLDTVYDSALGKTTGAGVYPAGKKINLRATALRGNVFAGWYADESYSTPLQGTVDYRTASFPYVVPEADSAVYAKFIPVAEDYASVSAEVAPEYMRGVEIDPVAVTIDGASQPKASAKGLPSGVRFNAKTNVIYGKPTRSGVYNATITVTTAGKAKATQSLKFIVRIPGETLLDTVYDSSLGKTTGAGVYPAGKKINLRATALRGNVFAGWYADESYSTPLQGTVDYRTASFPYVVPEADSLVYAKFIPAADDSAITFAFDESYSYNELSAMTPFRIPVESASLPKLTVRGLPKGLKFDSKSMSLVSTSAVPAPGVYKVTVKATNTSVRKAVEASFDIVVDNHTAANSYFTEPIANAPGERYTATVGIDVLRSLPSLELADDSYRLKVTGLPNGVKYIAAESALKGAPTRAGTYTVSLAVDGRVSTFTLDVEPLPDWVVGSFAFNMRMGTTSLAGGPWWLTREEMSITSTGKVSGKGVGLDGEIKSWTASLAMSEEDDGSAQKSFYVDRLVTCLNKTNYVFRVNITSMGEVVEGLEPGALSGGIYEEEPDNPFAPKPPSHFQKIEIEGGATVWQELYGNSIAAQLPAGTIWTNNLSGPVMAKVWHDTSREFPYHGNIYLALGSGGTVRSYYEDPDWNYTSIGSTKLALVSSKFGIEGFKTTWNFATAFAPVGRVPFIAFHELVVIEKEDVPLSVTLTLKEISAEDYDPYMGWVFGSFTGFQWVHDFDASENLGYLQLCTLTAARNGGFTMVGSALAGGERVVKSFVSEEIYGTRTESNYTAKVSYGVYSDNREPESFYYDTKKWEEMTTVATAYPMGGFWSAVYTGSGRGYSVDKGSFGTGVFFAPSYWDEGASDVPLISSTNRTFYIDIPAPAIEEVVGYDSVLTKFEMGANGNSTAIYHGVLEYVHNQGETNEFTTVTTNVITAADAYLDGSSSVKRIGGYGLPRCIIYDVTDDGWHTLFVLDGLAKGFRFTEYAGRGVIFSAVLDVFIPRGPDGYADIKSISAEARVVDVKTLTEGGGIVDGNVLIYPVTGIAE